MELTLANRASELQRLVSRLERFAQDHRIPKADVHAVTLALDEVITNTIAYGYDDHEPHEIKVRLTLANGRLTAEVEDDGRPFNPLTAPQPDLTSAVEDRPVGGRRHPLGAIADGPRRLSSQSSKNHLIMSKRLSTAAQPETKAGTMEITERKVGTCVSLALQGGWTPAPRSRFAQRLHHLIDGGERHLVSMERRSTTSAVPAFGYCSSPPNGSRPWMARLFFRRSSPISWRSSRSPGSSPSSRSMPTPSKPRSRAAAELRAECKRDLSDRSRHRSA